MTDGRTYTIKSVEENPDYHSIMADYNTSGNRWTPWNPQGIRKPDQYLLVETPYVVPNGKWVLERPMAAYSQLIGATVDDVQQIVLDNTSPNFLLPKRTLYVSDAPFGFIRYTEEDNPRFGWTPEGTRFMISADKLTLLSAHQIHKGELGRFMPIKKLNAVAEELVGPEEGASNGDRQRARMGWVRLVDLIIEARLNPVVFMDTFLAFGMQSIAFNENARQHKDAIQIVKAASADEIKGKRPHIESYTRATFVNALSETSLDDIWVRSGFANTVLRLITMGYAPQLISA